MSRLHQIRSSSGPLARRVWHELTRPRGPARVARSRRRSRNGIALLVAITSILFLTVLVTEISYAAVVRLQLGAHQRDEAKAEALAHTGVNLYRLILGASKGLGNNPMIQQVEAMLGMDLGDALWQMVPFINSGMMRMLFVTGGDADELDAPVDADDGLSAGLSDEQVAESREGGMMDRNFLDFDGDFYAEVTDEDRKVNVTRFVATNRAELQDDPTAVKLYGLMSGVRTCPSPFAMDENGVIGGSGEMTEEREDLDRFFLDRNIDRWELIGNLGDWTDLDNVRLYDGGSEDTLYNTLEHNPYLPKNAGFDTLEEIRLVDGWHQDDVWDRFGTNLTVYGNGKINVNTAECDVMWALIKSYVDPEPNDAQVERLMLAVEEQKLIAPFSSPANFVQFLQNQGVQVDSKLRSAVSTESKVFRVTSTGQVGEATVTIDAVLDFSKNQTGTVAYWRVR